MTAPDNVEMDRFIAGLNYPIYKDQILNEARRWDEGWEVSAALHNLPERLYENAADLAAALQKAQG
ncbi:MAG TPA: DUF2795 domain-containing protein [Chloroflexota bacterium]|nr:DUF2795 domain-containing protein [Chloroflexota bacterium]